MKEWLEFRWDHCERRYKYVRSVIPGVPRLLFKLEPPVAAGSPTVLDRKRSELSIAVTNPWLHVRLCLYTRAASMVSL